MAANLTNTWKQHAFPDDGPGREERWSLDSERRRIQDRTDFNLEQSGSTSKIRRFTGGRDDTPSGKAAKDRAAAADMMMVAATMQHANWNNPVTLTIGGQDFELTQGEWHDIARKYRQKVERDIEQARARGASDTEMAVLFERRESAERFVALAGKEDWSDQDRRDLSATVEANADMKDFVTQEARFRNDPGIGRTQTPTSSPSFDRESTAWDGGQGHEPDYRTSFAATVDDVAANAVTARLADKFAPAAENAPPAEMLGVDEAVPAAPSRTTGLDL